MANRASRSTVDLWYVRTDVVSDPKTIQACFKLMANAERERYQRFRFERHRHEYLVTRGLVRAVLSTYANRPASELAFAITEHGRPLLEDAGDLRFNLTNTTELVVCAVTHDGREVGVDAERLTRAGEILGIATTVFTIAERAALDELELPERQRRAVELWTLKEAYMKARGLGMSLPPETIELSFEGGEEGGGRGSIGVKEPNDTRRWTFTIFEIEGHIVSTCVSCDDPAREARRETEAEEHTLRIANLDEMLGDELLDVRR
jgi:4'-phosphopantetheinyl transferase